VFSFSHKTILLILYHNRFYCAIHIQIQNSMYVCMYVRTYVCMYVYIHILYTRTIIHQYAFYTHWGRWLYSLPEILAFVLAISCILLRPYLTHQWCKPDLTRFTDDLWSQQCKTILKHLKAWHTHPLTNSWHSSSISCIEVPRSFSQEPTWEKANKALGKVAHAFDDLRARSAVPSPYVSITCGKASPDDHG
jgi:hypothetical protein